MASTVILARHGRTLWNVEDRTQGHKGASLDELGQAQADELAHRLHSEHPTLDMILSSDLPRAAETAKIVAEVLGMQVHFDPRLRECAFGELEGLTLKDILEVHGETLRPAFEDYNHEYDFRPYGGECRAQVLERQGALLDELHLNLSLQKVALIGHGRSFNNLLRVHWPQVAAIKGNCEYRVVTLPSLQQTALRAKAWVASPEGQAKVKEIVETSAAVSRQRQEDEHVEWESLQRPVDRFD